MSAAYEKFQSISLVFVELKQEVENVQSFFLLRYAYDIKIKKVTMNDSAYVLTYALQMEWETGFSTKYIANDKHPQNFSIIFIAQHLFCVCDRWRQFYVKILGMSKITS